MLNNNYVDNFITKEIKFPLSSENFMFLYKIIKEENPDSILASLSTNLIKKYLEIVIKSENFFFYVCEYENKIIGYALLTKKPSFLISEFKNIKYLILINLLFSFKLKAIMNIFLSIFKIDLLLIPKKERSIINKNLNLNLLAINKNLQAKGFGKIFVLNILNDMKKKNNLQTVTLETHADRAVSFYLNSLNFRFVGKRLRFFKKQDVFIKEL